VEETRAALGPPFPWFAIGAALAGIAVITYTAGKTDVVEGDGRCAAWGCTTTTP